MCVCESVVCICERECVWVVGVWCMYVVCERERWVGVVCGERVCVCVVVVCVGV